jgi:hypothetical protein
MINTMNKCTKYKQLRLALGSGKLPALQESWGATPLRGYYERDYDYDK